MNHLPIQQENTELLQFLFRKLSHSYLLNLSIIITELLPLQLLFLVLIDHLKVKARLVKCEMRTQTLSGPPDGFYTPIVEGVAPFCT